ncbi:MAG: VWA domain-containing protein, partial [bacterium]
IKESSQVGLLCFSDRKEAYVKPGKGDKHAYQIISKLYDTQPVSTKTDLNAGMNYLLNILKRRSIIILVSDFIDDGYLKNLKAISRKHDLIVVHLSDKRETHLPSLGIVPVYDKESRKTIWVNSSSSFFRSRVSSTYAGTRKNLEDFCRKHQADYLSIATEEDYVPKLINLFRVRKKIRKSA